MRRNKIGYETALKLINSGQVEYQKLGTQYKIKVSKNEKINEENQRLHKRVTELETCLKAMLNIGHQAKI